jgi:hypothetical protein
MFTTRPHVQIHVIERRWALNLTLFDSPENLAICFSYLQVQFELDYLTTLFLSGQHEGHFVCDSGHIENVKQNFLLHAATS